MLINEMKKVLQNKKKKKRGKGLPYIFKNKVYLGKIPQTGTGVVSRVIPRLLANVGDVIGL